MLKTRVMPCLLLKDGSLVKTVRFRNPSYIGDPINAVRIYNEKEVDEIIFLDITATLDKRGPPFKTLLEIASECFMPMAYGGGVRRIEDIQELFRIGIEKVAINSYSAEDPDFLREAAEKFGSQSIVASIDARRKGFGKYEVVVQCGHRATGIDPADYAKRMQSLGAGEILLTSIDRDGTYEGYDIELVRRVTSVVNVPVIACGGAGKIEDFPKIVREGGASACAIGSLAVYYGRNRAVLINFPRREELEAVLEQDGRRMEQYD